MKGKKGFELSVTFLVILIITIVIFTGSISFTKKFFTSADAMRASIDAQTEADIQALLYQESSLVAIPTFKKTIPRGQNDNFGIGIRNVAGDTMNFYALVSFSKGYTVDEEIIQGIDTNYMNEHWILYDPGPYVVENNELEMIPIMAIVDLKVSETKNTERGIYSFNICIIAGQIPSGFDCAVPPRPLPPEVYSGKVYKFYVEVR